MSEVAIIGTGYVGLTTGACLAAKGNDVWCMDIDANKIRSIQNGRMPFYEPGLEPIVMEAQEKRHLKLTTDLGEAVSRAEIVMFALPTPRSGNGEADVSRVLERAEQVGKLADHYMVVATKSTVPPGTARKVQAELLKNADPALVDVASNPEFLAQGDAVKGSTQPDRIVVGVDTDRAWSLFEGLYLPFVPNHRSRLIRTDIESAEVIKYAANTMLAGRVALVNQIAMISELSGADARSVMEVVGLDPRIGDKFLNQGPGFGGSCFGKDVEAFVAHAASLGYDFSLGREILDSNAEQKQVLGKKVRKYLGDDLRGKRVAVLGESFKPRTDDVRDSPAFELIDSLLEGGAIVSAYDPQATEKMRAEYEDRDVPNKENLIFKTVLGHTLPRADAVVIVTDWDEFKSLPWGFMSKVMNQKLVIDGRATPGMSTIARQHGFTYDGLGDGRKV